MAYADPEDRKRYRREYYLKHREEIIARTLAHHKANAERYKKKAAERYLRNRDRMLAQQRAYVESHREQRRACRHTHYLKNKAKNNATAAAWYRRHKARHVALMKAWEAAHPDLGREYANRRRAAKNGNGGQLHEGDWQAIQAAYRHRCAYCGKRRKLTQDHVIPISKGGPHSRDNIVPACISCNSAKFVNAPPVAAIRLVLL